MAGHPGFWVAAGEIGRPLPSAKSGDAEVNDSRQDSDFTEFHEPRHCRVHEFETKQQRCYQSYVGDPGWEFAIEKTSVGRETRKKQWRYVTFWTPFETQVDDKDGPCDLERRCQVEFVRPRHPMSKFLKGPEHASEAGVGSIIPGVVKLFVISVILKTGIPSNFG